VRLEFTDLEADIPGSERALLHCDFLIGPLGHAFPGDHEPLWTDWLVCVLDAGNPRLRGGALTEADLAELPHAVATFAGPRNTPVDRVIGQLGISRHVSVRTLGYLPLPFVVLGTNTVAIVPGRLARPFRCRGLAVVEPPFGRVEMTEAAWWHPARAADAGAQWLLSLLREIATELR